MPLPAVAGAFAGLQGLAKLFDNKIIAYFVVLMVLFLDTSQASLLGNAGAVGGFLSWIIGMIFRVNIYIPSWFLLFLFIVFPFLVWFLAHTKQ